MAYKQDDSFTQMSATEISAALERGEATSEEVTRAHLDRIITLDGKLGAFVAVHRGEAMAAARKADEKRRQGQTGALLGVPVTVKENLDFEGRPATLGIVARKDLRARRDATIVLALKQAGAVILGQTNVPQLLLSHETRNPLYGATVNAFSDKHAPGGSSGGEASAIAAGLSPLGVGTDIGGSIRVPATWSGICGFKPSLDAWPNRGSNGALVGQETIRSQVGPMARTVSDLCLVMRSLDVAAMSADDPLFAPHPLADPRSVDVSKLRVGYFVDDGLVVPSQAVGRAVLDAAARLRRAGLEVKPFAPPRLRDAAALYFSIMSADGGETAWEKLEGGPVEPTLLPLRKAADLPGAVRSALARSMRLIGEDRTAMLLSSLGEKSVHDFWRLTREARAYRLELLEAMGREGVDLILCPAHATPAVPHGKSAEFLLAGASSMLFNLLQFPAGVVPVTEVRPSETSRDGRPADRFERIAALVDAQSLGLPVGVQLAGPPFKDAQVLAAMLALEALCDERPNVPRHV